MTDELEFSIIVPVYNARKYLEDCVSSVLKQSYDNYEIILVDDGSTDDSPQLCDSLAKEHPCIKVIHKSNSGPLESRRVGLSSAKGQWIIYLDSDDRLSENALQVLHDKAAKYPETDCMIIGFERLVGESTEKITDGIVKEDTYIDDKRLVCRTIFLNANCNGIWRKVARRSLCGKDDLSQWYEIRFGEDQIQTIEILKYCRSFLFIPDVLYQYRVNISGLTWSRDYSNFKVSFLKEELIVDFLKKEMIFTEEDLEDYRSYLNSWLYINLVEVATAKTSIRKKLEIYDQYRNAPFYINFLSKGTRKHITDLLWNKKYKSLLLYCLRIKAISVLSHKTLSFC